MANDLTKVTVEISGGQLVDVNWPERKPARVALEGARNLLASSPQPLNFALEYFGSELGYMVIMINGTFESLQPQSFPNYYWDFLVNNRRSSKGIDTEILNGGDRVTFVFEEYI